MRVSEKLRSAVVLFAICFAVGAFGQNARFSGQVTDPQGAIVSGATVTLTNLDSNAVQTTQSDAAGVFTFPFLAAARYQIQVKAEGFSPANAGPLSLSVGQALEQNVQLTLGAAQTEVVVQGSSEITSIHTDNPEISGTLTGNEVKSVPLNGRNFTQFIGSIAGVSNQTGQDEAKVGMAGSVAYSINGGRTEYNSFSVDGSDVLNVGLNRDHSTLVVYPSLDAIQEIKVLTSNYGAMYPSTGSGTTIVTTRSGGDKFHGGLYEFLRNEAFNAKGYFDVTKGAPLYRRNDFGGTIGGPVSIPHLYDAKGKTHFFFSEEARLEKSPTAYRQPVPSLGERNGDFSDVCPVDFQNLGAGITRAQYPDCPVRVYGEGLTGFVGNFVPMNSNAHAILNTQVIPYPNATSGCNTTTGSCYNVDVSLPTYWREELFRIDHTISPKLQASFRYIHDEWDETTPVPPYAFIQNSFPTINSRYYGPGLSLAGRLTASLSPTWLNEFVASYTDSYIKLTDVAAPGVSIQRPAGLDAPCATDANGSYQCPLSTIFNNGSAGRDGISKLPGVVIAGNNSEYGGVGFGVDPGYVPWRHTNPVYSFTDNVNKIFNKHNVQFGAQWLIYQRNQDNTPIGSATGDTQGILTFNNIKCGSYTGNSFADFLYYGYNAPDGVTLTDPAGIVGHVCSYQQDSGQGRYRQRYQIFEPYLQDDFKVTPHLTLNAGLRLSLFGLFHTANNNVSNWEAGQYKAANALAVDPGSGELLDPASGAPITFNPNNPQSGLDPRVLNGLRACGTSGCMSNRLVNPSPRIGMAWDVFGNGKMSLRAGYGIFFEHGTADEANTGSLEGSAPNVLNETALYPQSWNSIGTGVAYPLNVTAIPNKAIWSYVQQWSLGMEHALPKNMLLSVGYVGSKGTHLTAERQLNQLKPLAAADNPFSLHEPLLRNGFEYGSGMGDCLVQTALDSTGATVPFYQLANGATVGPGSSAYVNMEAACFGSSGPPGSGSRNINPNSLRQYAPGLGEIYSLENIADSRYDSLQATVRRTQGPVNVSLAYTYSHSIDDASDRSDSTFVNSFNIHDNRSSSNFDQRHLVHILYVYQLPALKILDNFLHFADSDPTNVAAHPAGVANDAVKFSDLKSVKAVFGGWELSGTTIFETGIPFTVVNNGSPSGISVLDNAGVANGQGYGSYPDVIGNPNKNLPHDHFNFGSVGPLLLNPGAFAAPRGLTFGNAGRNVLNNPSRWNWDIGMVKTMTITESASLQFRAETFNTFNNTQFRIYDPTLGAQAENTISCYGGYASNYSGSGGDGTDCLTAKSFLHPVDAHRPRTVQFALKLSF